MDNTVQFLLVKDADVPLDHVHYIQKILSELISVIHYRAVTKIYISGIGFGNEMIWFCNLASLLIGFGQPRSCPLATPLSQLAKTYRKKNRITKRKVLRI